MDAHYVLAGKFNVIELAIDRTANGVMWRFRRIGECGNATDASGKFGFPFRWKFDDFRAHDCTSI